MNVLQGAVLVAVISCASAQGFGFGGGFLFGSGAGGQSAIGQQESLQGINQQANFADIAQRDGVAFQSGLNAQQNAAAGLNGLGQAAANEQFIANEAFGAQLLANGAVKGEEFAQDDHISDIKYIDNKKGFSNVGVSIVDQQAFDKGNKLAISQGETNSAAARFFDNFGLAVQEQKVADIAGKTAVQSEDAIKTQVQKDAVIQAEDAGLAQQQSQVQAQEARDEQVRTDSGIFGGSGGFFNNNIFGKRRRR